LDLPDDSPALSMPWIITFGPADDEEEWEPVVCGPYERAHALALAEAVLADEEVMAVVEPLQPALTVEQIRGEIAASRLNADETEDDETEDDDDLDEHDHDHDHDHDEEVVTPSAPPAPEEIKAGFVRIAQALAE
jgi:hypothetical protein